MTFDRALGTAYRLSVLENDKDAAISSLKDWVAVNDANKTDAQAFVKANEKIPHDRCFITSTRVGLLKAALA